MINLFFLTISIIFIIEIIKFFEIFKTARLNIETSKNIFKVLKSNHLSDTESEELILKYAKTMFLNSIKIFTVFLIILVEIILLNKISSSFLEFLFSFYGICVTIIFSLFYIYLKKIINGKL